MAPGSLAEHDQDYDKSSAPICNLSAFEPQYPTSINCDLLRNMMTINHGMPCLISRRTYRWSNYRT